MRAWLNLRRPFFILSAAYWKAAASWKDGQRSLCFAEPAGFLYCPRVVRVLSQSRLWISPQTLDRPWLDTVAGGWIRWLSRLRVWLVAWPLVAAVTRHPSPVTRFPSGRNLGGSPCAAQPASQPSSSMPASSSRGQAARPESAAAPPQAAKKPAGQRQGKERQGKRKDNKTRR